LDGLLSYPDRRANRAERIQIEQHLLACVDCLADIEEFRALWSLPSEMPLAEPSSGFDACVGRRIAAEFTGTMSVL
jgi:hypothetical protein